MEKNVPPPASFDAFISHASEDRDAALELVSRLEERGFTCWVAPRNIRYGFSFPSEIVHGIERSRCVVVIHSDAANASVHVANEVKQAFDRQKVILPIRISDVSMSEDLSYYLSARHRIDACNRAVNDYLDEVIATLTDDKAPLKRPARRTRRMPVWTIPTLAVVCGFAATVGAIYFLRDRPPVYQPVSVAPEDIERRIRDARQSAEASMQAAIQAPTKSAKASDIIPRVESYDADRGNLSFFLEFTNVYLQPALRRAQLYYRFNDGPEVQNSNSARVSFRATDQQQLRSIKTLSLRFALSDGTSLGPFTYPFDLQQMKLQEDRGRLREQLDHQFASLQAGNSNIALRYLIENGLGELKTLALGDRPDKLDRRYELPTNASGFPEGNRSAYAIAVLSQERKVYVKLEYADGTTSAVREIRVDPDENLQFASLDPVNAAHKTGETKAFILYNGSRSYDSKVTLLATAPRNATRWLIAENDIRYPEIESPGEGYFVRADIKLPHGPKSALMIAWEDSEGKRHGPTAFNLSPAVDVVRKGLKQALSGQLKSRVVAVVVKPSATARGQTAPAREHGIYLTPKSAGIFVVPGPTNSPDLLQATWATIAEMRFGTRDTELNVRAPVFARVEDILAGMPVMPTGGSSSFWSATVPLTDSPYLFAQAVFHDGSLSEILRYPVKEMPVVE